MAIQISVIVAAYNCEKTVGIAINSILKQRFQNFELLVADDLSSDDTRNIIDSFKDARIRTFHNSEKLHVCGTWNKLLAKATGKYVTFHDADDVSYTNWLHRLNEHAEANSNCAVVGANHLRPFNWWGWYNISNFKLSYSEILNAAIYSSKVESFGARSLFLRSCVNELGGFRVLYQGCGWEDYDLFLRILERHEVCNIKDVLYEYAYNENSYSRIDLKNINLKKLFIHDIGFFLFHQRLSNNGLDSLMDGGDKEELNDFLNKLEVQYDKNTLIICEKAFYNKLSNLDFSGSLKILRQSIPLGINKAGFYIMLFSYVNSLFRALAKLFLIKINIINVKNRYNNLHL